MNLPWDKSYFKLSFYVIFTFICVYIAKYIIDTIAYALLNMAGIYEILLDIIGKIFSVFSVIIAGFVIAYVLIPLAELIEKKFKLRRTAAVFLTYAVVLFLIALLVLIFVLSMGGLSGIDIYEISNKMEMYARNINRIRENTVLFFNKFGLESVSQALEGGILSFERLTAKWALDIPEYLKDLGGKAVTGLLSILVSFYFIKDRESIADKIKEYGIIILPERIYRYAGGILRDMDSVFSGYIKGQLTDGVIMASLMSLGLAVIKVPFPVVIGIVSGFLNIIPYFGSILGLCIAVFMALVSGNVLRAVYTAVLVVALQQIDTAFIVPKVVGESVRLSPLMIIVSLAVAARLFGLWGLVLAVPAVAVFKIRLDRYCEKKKIYIENEDNKTATAEHM